MLIPPVSWFVVEKRVKNRTLLGLLLFVALSLAFFSIYALVIAFVLPEESMPIVDTGKKAVTVTETPAEEVLRFGSQSSQGTLPNIFDATMREVTLLAEENPEALSKPKEVTIEEINELLDNPQRCPALSGYALLGTGLAVPERESFVLLSGAVKGSSKAGGPSGSEQQVFLVRVDGELDGGTVLAAVRRNLAAFKTPAGVRCLGENVGKESALGTEEKKEIASAPGDLTVQQTGPNSYRLSREDLNRATANLNSLASEARIVPDKQENGFKIFSIRPGSIWQKIGIQNGDVIKSINGIELSSPDKALEAYGRLRNASKLSLDIVRRGKRETMEYTID